MADPLAPPPEPPYTGWHFFFAKLLEKSADPDKLEVRPFDKLGSLPLEADAIVLRKIAEIDGLFRYPDLDFLRPFLARYSVLEYKSPAASLSVPDFDTTRGYSVLCKRKYEVYEDADLSMIYLYSHVTEDFFAACARFGYPFEDQGTGVRTCQRMALRYHALNLVELGQLYPGSLVNLLSARRRQYRPVATGSDERDWLARDLFYATLAKEMKKMLEQHADLPGLSEVNQDLDELRRQVMAMHTVEERLEGLSPAERLEGLSPEQIIKSLPGLSLEQREQMLRLLQKQRS